ncbi:MAG: hypothetical protein ACK5DG_06570 [Chitinophagaceae bacterium]|jgi:hypothetical protein
MKEPSTIFVIKKLLSFYLLCGSVFYLCMILYSYGVLGFLTYLFPLFFLMSLLMFFIYSGYKGLIARQGYSFKLVQWSFFIQAIHIKLLGFKFENFFGPYWGVGFSDEPTIRFYSSFKIFWYYFLNGYNKDSSEISITINLIALSIGFVLGIKEKKIEPEIFQ